MSTPQIVGAASLASSPAGRTRRRRRGRCEHDEGSSVAWGTGRASARGVRNLMRADFRPDQAGREEQSRIQSTAGQTRGKEEGKGKSWASEEEGRGQSSAGQARGEEEIRGQSSAGQAGGEEEGRGRSRRLAEEGGRSEEEGGDWPGGPEEEGGRRAERHKRTPGEGRRDSEEGRRPKSARAEGEEVVAGVRDEALLVGARGLRCTEHESTGSPTSENTHKTKFV